MYAIVKVGGKQYRVEKGDSIVVDRMRAGEGDKVALEPLMYADGDKSVLSGPDLEKVKVEATVTGHERGKKIHVLKFKPKRGYKRRSGHRSDLTRLQIGDIKVAAARADVRSRPSASARKGGRGRWLIRRDSDRAATAATRTPSASA